jgi:4a-hydroxytetrahydrobiopterin dehydratase
MAWTEQDGALVREVRVADFLQAFRLVEALVAPAEAAGHHPDVAFGWGYVRVALRTHDEGAITAQDHALAAEIDRAFAALGA